MTCVMTSLCCVQMSVESGAGRKSHGGLAIRFVPDANGTFVGSVEQANTRPSDDVGALYYVVAVIFIYGCSILMMIASYIRKNNADRRINRYLKEMTNVRKRAQQMQLMNAAARAAAERLGMLTNTEQKGSPSVSSATPARKMTAGGRTKRSSLKGKERKAMTGAVAAGRQGSMKVHREQQTVAPSALAPLLTSPSSPFPLRTRTDSAGAASTYAGCDRLIPIPIIFEPSSTEETDSDSSLSGQHMSNRSNTSSISEGPVLPLHMPHAKRFAR